MSRGTRPSPGDTWPTSAAVAGPVATRPWRPGGRYSHVLRRPSASQVSARLRSSRSRPSPRQGVSSSRAVAVPVREQSASSRRSRTGVGGRLRREPLEGALHDGVEQRGRRGRAAPCPRPSSAAATPAHPDVRPTALGVESRSTTTASCPRGPRAARAGAGRVEVLHERQCDGPGARSSAPAAALTCASASTGSRPGARRPSSCSEPGTQRLTAVSRSTRDSFSGLRTT